MYTCRSESVMYGIGFSLYFDKNTFPNGIECCFNTDGEITDILCLKKLGHCSKYSGNKVLANLSNLSACAGGITYLYKYTYIYIILYIYMYIYIYNIYVVSPSMYMSYTVYRGVETLSQLPDILA